MNIQHPYSDLLQKFTFTTETVSDTEGKELRILPYADLAAPYVCGPEISGQILNMYRYPCRLKACIFVVILEGEADMNINLGRYVVKANHFVCIAPESIIQCHSFSDDLRLGFIAFSSASISDAGIQKSIVEYLPHMKEQPLLMLRPEVSSWFKDYFTLLSKAHLFHPGGLDGEIVNYIFLSVFFGVKYLYRLHPVVQETLSRPDEIYRELQHLLKEHYSRERGVAFYAERLNLTPQHLSTVIRQVSGQTVSDMIAGMITMDAKAQLKSTNLKMKEIAASLNFPNLSYFGKYFKRHTGMSPQRYRDSNIG